MAATKHFPPDIRHDNGLCCSEPATFSSMRQTDIKPMLKALFGICLFFVVLAVLVGCSAAVVVLIRSLARLV